MASLIVGNIYKIISPNTDQIYIGSTTQTLRRRMQEHINEHAKKKERCTSKIILDAGNATIELIEVFNCDNRKQLLQREGFYIKQYASICVNKVIPDRTRAEYYQDNRDEISTHRKQYKEAHKEQIAIYTKQYNEAHKEQRKAYYEINKNEIAAKKKQYRDTHKNEIAAQKKQYRIIHKNEINAKDKQRRQAKRQAEALASTQSDPLLK